MVLRSSWKLFARISIVQTDELWVNFLHKTNCKKYRSYVTLPIFQRRRDVRNINYQFGHFVPSKACSIVQEGHIIPYFALTQMESLLTISRVPLCEKKIELDLFLKDISKLLLDVSIADHFFE